MKNKMIKRIILCAFILMFYILINKSQANSIKNIEMDVNLDENGNALVTETWQVDSTQGTEGYRAFSKLENSTITDFSVVDESGRKYQTISDWNTNESFDYKAYKCGIKEKSNGVELCWGISQYGNKTYTLTYKINKLVTQYTDCQGIYFNFLNLDQDINNATIKIYCNFYDLSAENSKIWAYGYEGAINFKDGSIILDSNGEVSESQYMVGLIKFENNIFSTNNKSNLSFEKVKKSAEKESKFSEILIILVTFIPLMLIALIIAIVGGKSQKIIIKPLEKIDEPLKFDAEKNKLPNEVEYFRDMPSNKSLEIIYWICCKYYISSAKVLRKGLVGAIFLKWFKEEKITINKVNNRCDIDLNKINNCDNEIEEELLKMLKAASGKNKILESKEFSIWCKKNYKNITNWFNNVRIYAEQQLEQQGMIVRETSSEGEIRIVSDELKEEAIKLKGLKRFLLEYSNISEKGYMETYILEDYLIFAQLLGIAKKVQEQFKLLYPDFKIYTTDEYEDVVVQIDNIIDTGFREARISEDKDKEKSKKLNEFFKDNDDGTGGASNPYGGGSAGGSSGGGFR